MRKKTSQNWIVIALIAGVNWTGLFAIGQTLAYYNDTETSSENILSAGSLDFALSQYSFESFIGLDETISKSTVIVNSDGMDFQYTLEAEEVSNEDSLCDALNLQAKLNGIEQYDGNLMSFITSASTTLGTWKFNVELPVDETSFTNGAECKFDVVFKGWQTNIGSYGDGGFSDEERMSFTVTAGKMVVLNEFLPRPDGVAYGFDFGNDSSDMPQGEWIELYNNSAKDIDLSGWYTRDSTNGEGNKVVITVLNTSLATTTIGSKSWLVVYMNKSILNNTGDTVRLFDDSDNLIDSHSYSGNPDFCEIEPTPGDENPTDASGSCGSVPPNKSYARIPDGIGDWVDPIPSPGKQNVLEATKPSESEPTTVVSEQAAIPEETPIIEEISTTTPEIIETATTTLETAITIPKITPDPKIIPETTEIQEIPTQEIPIIEKLPPTVKELPTWVSDTQVGAPTSAEEVVVTEKQPIVVEEEIVIEEPPTEPII